MTALFDRQIDQYSGFDHKKATGEPQNWLASWVPEGDKRRQMAYVVARSIHENVSRYLLPAGSPDDDFEELREYGDPAAYSSAVAGGVLGAEVLFQVVGADAELPDQPVLPHAPEPPQDPDPHGVLAAAHQAQVDVWKANSFDAIERWKELHLERPKLQAAQKWLRAWAAKDRTEAKLREMYRDVVQPLGDGVISLRCAPGKLPESELWDPESYFPDFPDGEVSEFPDAVVLAYEYQDDDGEKWLRRARYELRPLVVAETGEPGVRDAPYPMDGPMRVACTLTDGHFPLGGAGGAAGEVKSVHDYVDSDADRFETIEDADGNLVELRGFDLGIDYIPVYHVPANPSSRNHFGRSMYLRAGQLFDDLYEADTAIAAAANLAANPPLVVKGAVLQTGSDGRVAMGPGKLWSTPDGSGGIDKLAMSEELRVLLEHRQELKRRASQNLQVPEGVMGQASPEKIASGITLALTFTPFERVVMEARLVLLPKLSLYLKGVMRMAIVARSPGWEDVRGVPMATVALGSFMPTDMPSLVEMVSVLRSAKVLSRKVAATWLQAAGMSIEDVDQLLAELDSEDTERALDLEAMFGAAVAAKLLGIELDQETLDRRAQAEESSGLGRFGSNLNGSGRSRPERPALPGEDPADELASV